MRSIWSGSISFGLVNIPVRLYSASKERALSFRLLDRTDLCPISYQKVCRADDRVVEQENLVRGFEYKKDQYVVLDEEDFRRADPRKTDLLDVVQTADYADINPLAFDKPYYLEPDEKARKPYVLLREALKRSGKVAVVSYVLREREHIGVLAPQDNALLLLELRYAEEIRPVKDLALPRTAPFSRREMELAQALVKHLDAPFHLADFHDTYSEELREVIKRKAQGKLARIEEEPVPPPEPTEVEDVLDLLKESLAREPAGTR